MLSNENILDEHNVTFNNYVDNKLEQIYISYLLSYRNILNKYSNMSNIIMKKEKLKNKLY
jgi:hypothetical protein